MKGTNVFFVSPSHMCHCKVKIQGVFGLCTETEIVIFTTDEHCIVYKESYQVEIQNDS